MKKSILSILTFLITFALHAQDSCSIASFSYEIVKEGNEMFFVKINLPQNSIEEFSVFINDEHFPEPIEKSDDGYYYGPVVYNCSISNSLLVSRNDNENCSIKVNMGFICTVNDDCSFYNIKHEVIECDENIAVIALNFDHRNTQNEYFELYDSNNNLLGYYKYESLPIRFEYKRDDTGIATLLIKDNDNSECAAYYSFVLGCINPDECAIYDLRYDPSDCIPGGSPVILLNFKHQNTSDSFFLKGNGRDYGIYAYADLPIQFGPFDNACDGPLEFVVIDQKNEECYGVLDNVWACCGEPCIEPLFEVVNLECRNTGIGIKLELIIPELRDSLLIYIDGQIVSHYRYDYPYVYFEIPNTSNAIERALTVCVDNYFSDACCFTQTINTEECYDRCYIGDIKYQVIECGETNENPPYVLLGFDYRNTASDSFTIRGNGTEYGIFAYKDLPVAIGPFDNACDKRLEFIIRDSKDEECKKVIEGVVACCPGPCVEPAFEIIHQECSFQEVFLKLELFEKPVYEDITVKWNEREFNEFRFDFPYVYVYLPNVGDSIDQTISICTKYPNFDNCCYTVPFSVEECTPVSDCEIWGLRVTPFDCNEAEVPYVILDFEYAGTGEEGFTVKGNGHNYGVYKYEELPVRIPIEINCDQFYEFVVIDNQKDGCSNYIEYGPMCCNNECSFYPEDLRVRCLNDSLLEVAFYLFEATDPIKKYKIWVNDFLVAETEVNNEFMEYVLPFAPSNADMYVMKICDETCCITRILEPENCNKEGEPSQCAITNMESWDISCGDEGIGLTLNFNHEGSGNLGFDVYSLTGHVGFYSYEDLPVRIENLPIIPNSGVNGVLVCDNDSDCCSLHLFNQVQCSATISGSKDVMYENNDNRYIKQNPVSNELILESPVDQNQYTILGVNGTFISQFLVNSKATVIDISTLKSGLYLVRISNERGIKVEKLVVTN